MSKNLDNIWVVYPAGAQSSSENAVKTRDFLLALAKWPQISFDSSQLFTHQQYRYQCTLHNDESEIRMNYHAFQGEIQSRMHPSKYIQKRCEWSQVAFETFALWVESNPILHGLPACIEWWLYTARQWCDCLQVTLMALLCDLESGSVNVVWCDDCYSWCAHASRCMHEY